ncbi:MAG TPA: DUF4041 domain-containing protein [Pseudomonadales bacterium]|nr:DUF4041 domain-containing protein [Pseudomonadales bacterium]
MSIVIYSTMLGLSAGYAAYGYWHMQQVKDEYTRVKRHIFPVQRERNLIAKRLASYQELQQRYREERQQLKQCEEIIQTHHIGVGTFDPVLYKRSKDIADLEVLDTELQHVSRQIATMAAEHMAVDYPAEMADEYHQNHAALRLRCFDAEADAAIAQVTWYNVHRLSQRLRHCCKDIGTDNDCMGVTINPDYRDLRLHQLRLVYEIKQLHEDQDALKNAQNSTQQHQELALEKALQQAMQETTERQASLEEALFLLDRKAPDYRQRRDDLLQLLALIKSRMHYVQDIQQNPQAGFVYVASNEGVFSNRMVKIGACRHPDPERHIKDISQVLPTSMDIHGVFFSTHTERLLDQLHQTLADHQVNLTDSHKGFYFVKPEVALHHIENIQRSNDNINIKAV